MNSGSKEVKVNLGARSYKAVLGRGVIDTFPKLLGKVKSKRAFIVSDRNLVQARERLIQSLQKAGWEVHEFPKPAGERLKELDQITPLFGELLNAKANRDSTLFALGGGTIGDAAGFVAASYLRGISWVGIPTTLLAQVDSSLGGKTGINHPEGKNLIGAFHQPSLVVCETDFLSTLSKREMVSGLSEMIKYGIIYDQKLFKDIVKNQEKIISNDTHFIIPTIHKALSWKAKVVAKDEYDRKGTREALNFGHTFGHALEAATGYAYFQHGEAVLWGMRYALALSNIKKKLSLKDYEFIDGALAKIPVPPIPPGTAWEVLRKHLTKDKKVRDSKLHFVLLKRLGLAVSDSNVTEIEQVKAFDRVIRGSR
jgi:3-dehydroquinate synthase